MRLLGQFYTLYFFYEKILHSPKAPKARRRNQAKAQKATSEQKMKKCLKKHLRGKTSLIRLCAFLCFLWARRKEKKIEKREKSPQCKCTKYRCPYN